MNQKQQFTSDKPRFEVLGERTFEEWDVRSELSSGELGPTIAQEYEAKANTSGAQGAFFSREPEHLSLEADKYNRELAAKTGNRRQASTEAIVALVARMEPLPELPPIKWQP